MNETKSINASVEDVVTAVLSAFGDELGAGALAKAATAVAKIYELKKLNNKTNEVEDYVVYQQMTTNYLGNGGIDGIKRSSAAGVTVTSATASAWLVRFFEKKINGIVVRSSRGVNAEAIADQARLLLGLEKPVTVVPAEQDNEATEDDFSEQDN